MNKDGIINLLNNEFGVELINNLILSSKTFLGWNDFISEFSKHFNSTLISDLFEVEKNWKNKQMQYQYEVLNKAANNEYLKSLLADADSFQNRKMEIKIQLIEEFRELISSMSLLVSSSN